MNKDKTLFDVIIFVITCIFAIFWMVISLMNLCTGLYRHETYYLVLSIIDYYFMKCNLKDIEKYLDIKD